MSSIVKKYLPEEDGITHINVYSQGRTELGRLLSNFAHTPFDMEPEGHFECVESYWYWLLTGAEECRSLVGYRAKKVGLELLRGKAETVSREQLLKAYKAKLTAHPRIQRMLNENNLPFAHYYVYGGKTVTPRQWLWTAELWNELKKQ